MQSITSNNNTIVAGDLNAHNTMWNSAETDKYGLALETVMGELNLNVHHPDSPTYAPLHRLHYAATLDLVITMDSPDVSVSKPIALTSPRSDHLPILFTVESKPARCPLLKVQEQLITTPIEVAYTFSEQLKQTFTPTKEPEFYEPIKATIENAARQMLKTPEHGHQSFQPTTAHEIRGRGAPGADKITNKALKQLPEEFHQVMTNVANSSMKLSHIPKQWKHAEIVMIPKPGKNPSDPTSYRPISREQGLSSSLVKAE